MTLRSAHDSQTFLEENQGNCEEEQTLSNQQLSLLIWFKFCSVLEGVCHNQGHYDSFD